MTSQKRFETLALLAYRPMRSTPKPGTRRSMTMCGFNVVPTKDGWRSKDTAILRHHKSSLVGETLRVFAFDSAQLTGAEMAERFSKHALGIERRCHKPGPNVYVLHAHTIELRWPSEG